MFITFEGVDFVGKSTQANRLYYSLKGEIDILLTHEPGGTDFGMRIREIIKSEPSLSVKSQFHLIESQRSHHVETVLLPQINQGTTIICDRFIDTSYVYQHDYMTEIEWMYYLDAYPIIPDLTFFLWSANLSTIRTDRARENVVNDHFDNESTEKLNRKQKLFFDLANTFPRIVSINTDRSIETIATEIYAHVRNKLEDSVHSQKTTRF